MFGERRRYIDRRLTFRRITFRYDGVGVYSDPNARGLRASVDGLRLAVGKKGSECTPTPTRSDCGRQPVV